MINESTKKTALITGAAKGIGAACAEVFAAHGYNIALNYLTSEAAANKTIDKLRFYGANANKYCYDVSDYLASELLFEEVICDFGGIDVLINNAGISEYSLLIDMSKESFDKMMSVNLGSVFNCSKQAIRHMLKKGGSIVNISSMWGLRAAAFESHYSASKAAVISLTQSLAKEYASTNIRLNAVAAGAVDTDMMADFNKTDIAKIIESTPLGRLAQPEDIAKAVYFLASDDANFITGQTLTVDGGYLL